METGEYLREGVNVVVRKKKRKVRIVPNWRDCWRWTSVRCMVAAAAVQGSWLEIPADMKSSIPPAVVSFITLGLLALGTAGRFVDQGEHKDD